MEKINLDKFRSLSNYVLIKPDPDFEFIEIQPDSEFSALNEPVKIQIGYTSETHAKHYGITGQVLAVPEKLTFNKQRIKDFKRGKSMDQMGDMINLSHLMNASQEIDVDMELMKGDKVWFSYLCQINAIEQKLLVDTEEYGLCFLAKYEDIYCYERNGDLNLINGWVWIQRIKKTDKTASGLEVQWNEKNQYEPNRAIIVKSAPAVKAYLDGEKEDAIDFVGGEQVYYNSAMGFEMEYSLHRKLTQDPVLSIRRKHIYAVI